MARSPITILRDDLVPIAVFLAVGAILALAAHAPGENPLAARTWAHWDSGWYESIASHGYRIEPCPSRPGAGALCGNAGWFPGYPLVIAALMRIGVPMPAGGVALSWIFSLATLILLWRTFLDRRLSAPALACLGFAACPPGAVFHYAEFPLSMNAFFMALALWLLHRRRWLAAGLAGAVACFTYAIGVVFAPVVLVWAFFVDRDVPLRERVRRAALSGGLMALGAGLVVFLMLVSTGHWDAYFLVQSNYGHHLVWPGRTFWDRVWPLFDVGTPMLRRLVALQTLLVAAFVIGLMAQARARARVMDATEWLILASVVVLWLFPLTQLNAPLWRSAGVLAPAALLVRRMPAVWGAAVVVTSFAIAVPVTMLFV